MPADKQTRSANSKPLTPALSSNFRNARNPLTPRLAGSAPTTPAIPSASRKDPFARSVSPGKGEPVVAQLNGNVTPRSGARKSRLGTESPMTPASAKGHTTGVYVGTSSGNEDATPSHVQAPSHVAGLGISSPRLAASTNALPKVANAAAVPHPTLYRRDSAAQSMVDGDRDDSIKFFYADDAKSSVSSPGVVEGPHFPHSRTDSFTASPSFHNPVTPDPAREQRADSTEPPGKFFRAGDVSYPAVAKRPIVAHLTSEPPARASHLRSAEPFGEAKGRQATPGSPLSPDRKQHPLLTQASSPPKEQKPPLHPTLARPRATTGGSGASQDAARITHRKVNSRDSTQYMPDQHLIAPARPLVDVRLASTGSSRISDSNTLSPETLSPTSMSIASSNPARTSLVGDADIPTPARLPPALNQPAVDPSPLPVPPQNDEATNARRERKVLDLEISNSSLLAINKTLERELRKQNGELRRFRRLSRSGRLSLAPANRSVSAQSGISLDTLPELDAEDPLSDSDEGSGSEDVDDEDDSLSSNESGSLTSPSARARQRARDERRLLLDLAKHQQLLVDSQKLSQSIRRCLTCTEDMLREGNKALDYRVGIGDVKLGGRVLNDEELDARGLDDNFDEGEPRQGLLSPSVAKVKLHEPDHWPDIASDAVKQELGPLVGPMEDAETFNEGAGFGAVVEEGSTT